MRNGEGALKYCTGFYLLKYETAGFNLEDPHPLLLEISEYTPLTLWKIMIIFYEFCFSWLHHEENIVAGRIKR